MSVSLNRKSILLEGQSGLGFSDDNIRVRQVKPEHLEQVKHNLQDNNVDELLLQTQTGDYFLVYADELETNLKGSHQLNNGDFVHLIDMGLEGIVIDSNDEWNEEYQRAGAGAGVAAVMGTGLGWAFGAAAGLVGVTIGGSAGALIPNFNEDYDSLEKWSFESSQSQQFQNQVN